MLYNFKSIISLFIYCLSFKCYISEAVIYGMLSYYKLYIIKTTITYYNNMAHLIPFVSETVEEPASILKKYWMHAINT